jgi:hypothetical protein
MDERDRKAIIARRARFVAAAVAALSSVEGCRSPEPLVCLSPKPPEVVVPEADGAAEPSTSDSGSAEPEAGSHLEAPADAEAAPPRMCLSFEP